MPTLSLEELKRFADYLTEEAETDRKFIEQLKELSFNTEGVRKHRSAEMLAKLVVAKWLNAWEKG